ncbi:zinc ribbon protein [Pontibacter ummariensis]|uniref:Zinc-ribbon domain-containing protein n=1 Tax=Pontibacter ummariensis TaxID=1610492 RepID=A0A239CGI6_9BACT|nr:zinc ribbon domain-containing protein [Pontibacter ummariensis]PRY15024.1 zinc ribbon protein [Pontibacter ummariensis]SNS19297.1 zinc-ribbon domain-containing protein [Pontibacter ummariensis]
MASEDTNEQLITCPNCKRLVPASDKRCPYCGEYLPQPEKEWKFNFSDLTAGEIFLIVLGTIMLLVGLVAV